MIEAIYSRFLLTPKIYYKLSNEHNTVYNTKQNYRLKGTRWLNS